MPLTLERPTSIGIRSPRVLGAIEEHASDRDGARRLAARVFLQLPRLADASGRIDAATAVREIRRLALAEEAPPPWLRPPGQLPNSPLDLSLTELDPARARVLHERFHYLRSYRPGLHLAGIYEDRVAVLLSFSALDLGPIASRLPLDGASRAMVLSRVFAAPWAPRNSLSRLLSLAASDLRERDADLGALLTYVNPGLGFDGASYRASNWTFFGREHGTRYAYLDADYITDRELSRRFGTSETAALTRALGGRVAFSRMTLPPLDLYALGLSRGMRARLGALAPNRWQRPWD